MIGFNVAQLLKAPTGTIRRVQVDEPDRDLEGALHVVSPTVGSLRLMRTAAGILVTGTLSHSVESVCSRCLETFVRAQVIELTEEFMPVADVNTGFPVAEPDDPDVFRLTPDHLLDLTEAIRQYAILEDPLQLLCERECKGLCSECGANLNLGPCGCELTSSTLPRGSFGTLLAERMRRAGFQARTGVDTIGRSTEEEDFPLGARQAQEPSWDGNAEPRGLPPVPQSEVASSRLSHLRHLPGSAGPEDQANEEGWELETGA